DWSSDVCSSDLTFRALANAGGGVLADRVAQFAIAGREAVASGIAVSSAAAFAAELRRAGDLLVRSGTGDEEALATELDALTAALRAIQPGAAPAPALAPAAPAPAPRPAPPSRPTPPPAPAPGAVDVRALLYRGARALQRAQELRAAAKRASGDELRALVDEVCALVALALEPSP